MGWVMRAFQNTESWCIVTVYGLRIDNGSLGGALHLSPYYSLRFPFVALAIKPNANEMNMQRK